MYFDLGCLGYNQVGFMAIFHIGVGELRGGEPRGRLQFLNKMNIFTYQINNFRRLMY